MTIDRTEAGHQTRYVLRYGGTESCMLTYGTAEIAPAVWKILLPGPEGADAIYGTEQFLSPDAVRLRSWLVLPDRAGNFAFLGQSTDLPEDVVFTVEYSVHGAMRAVYGGVAKEIPPIYHGLLDPKVGLKALESAFR
jgi:hypothetical protein